MALTSDLGTMRDTRIPGALVCLQSRPSVVYRPGSIVCHRVGSKLMEVPLAASPRTDLIVCGIFVGLSKFTASSTTDSGGGAVDADSVPEQITGRPGTLGTFATGSGANEIKAVNVDQACFLYDDDTVYLTSLNGTLSFAGFVDGVGEDGRVYVRMGENDRTLAPLFSPGESVPGFTSDDSARAVATDIPAGAFAAGVWTATATGAIGTQDGLTIALGDKVIFPLGTLTTQAVSAANSGPYECTVVGATGVKAVFSRPARFQHGDVITPGTTVTVGGEGTTYKNTKWIAKPATAAKVVGTDDPLMFPAEMIVALTCSSGTANTAVVPLRAAGLFYVGIDYTGGTPAATTTSLQASTQTPGGIGTASIVIQEQSHLGTLVNTGTATANVIVRQ